MADAWFWIEQDRRSMSGTHGVNRPGGQGLLRYRPVAGAHPWRRPGCDGQSKGCPRRKQGMPGEMERGCPCTGRDRRARPHGTV